MHESHWHRLTCCSCITQSACYWCAQSVFGVWGERASFNSSQWVLLSATYVCEVSVLPLQGCAIQLWFNDNHLSICTQTVMHACPKKKRNELHLLTIFQAVYEISRKINVFLTEPDCLGEVATLFSACTHTFFSGIFHSKSWWAFRPMHLLEGARWG